MAEALLQFGDKEIKLPVVNGTEDEAGLDITQLAAETGLFTLDRGFGNTAVWNGSNGESATAGRQPLDACGPPRSSGT